MERSSHSALCHCNESDTVTVTQASLTRHLMIGAGARLCLSGASHWQRTCCCIRKRTQSKLHNKRNVHKLASQSERTARNCLLQEKAHNESCTTNGMTLCSYYTKILALQQHRVCIQNTNCYDNKNKVTTSNKRYANNNDSKNKTSK